MLHLINPWAGDVSRHAAAPDLPVGGACFAACCKLREACLAAVVPPLLNTLPIKKHTATARATYQFWPAGGDPRFPLFLFEFCASTYVKSEMMVNCEVRASR